MEEFRFEMMVEFSSYQGTGPDKVAAPFFGFFESFCFPWEPLRRIFGQNISLEFFWNRGFE